MCLALAQQPAPEAVVAKRQISLWTDKEKSSFMDAYKVVISLPRTSTSSAIHSICPPRGRMPVHAAACITHSSSLPNQPAL